MKNLARAFALSLVATGAFAATQAPQPKTTAQVKASAFPVPWCDPTTQTCTLQ
jgi:hypothetical protein